MLLRCLTVVLTICCVSTGAKCGFAQLGTGDLVSRCFGKHAVDELLYDARWQLAIELSPEQAKELAKLRERVFAVLKQDVKGPDGQLPKFQVGDMEAMMAMQDDVAQKGLQSILTEEQLDRYPHLMSQKQYLGNRLGVFRDEEILSYVGLSPVQRDQLLTRVKRERQRGRLQILGIRSRIHEIKDVLTAEQNVLFDNALGDIEKLTARLHITHPPKTPIPDMPEAFSRSALTWIASEADYIVVDLSVEQHDALKDAQRKFRGTKHTADIRNVLKQTLSASDQQKVILAYVRVKAGNDLVTLFSNKAFCDYLAVDVKQRDTILRIAQSIDEELDAYVELRVKNSYQRLVRSLQVEQQERWKKLVGSQLLDLEQFEVFRAPFRHGMSSPNSIKPQPIK